MYIKSFSFLISKGRRSFVNKHLKIKFYVLISLYWLVLFLNFFFFFGRNGLVLDTVVIGRFFVIANSIASLHNLSLLVLLFLGKKLDGVKGLGLLITISDMVIQIFLCPFILS